MTWNETHLRWRALREIEASLADVGSTVPWRPQYAALFGDRDGLRAFLRYRWNLRLEAQLDPYLTDLALDERHAALATARAGLRVLDREEGCRAVA